MSLHSQTLKSASLFIRKEHQVGSESQVPTGSVKIQASYAKIWFMCWGASWDVLTNLLFIAEKKDTLPDLGVLGFPPGGGF